MTNQPNVSWPGWEVVRLIGHGSFGAVYEIQRNTFGHVESAALKVITIPDNASDIEDLYNDGYTVEDVTMRFQGYLEDIIREYSLMVDMKGHANVVYCDDFRYVQHEDGIGWDIYIKMELLIPLTKALPKTIEERQVIDLGVDICNALVMCKERNIVHRDIKPQNIFVSKDGTHKLGDFGIAKTAERTTSGTKIGTYKYMAPEVYNNKPYGAGADIYSLGLLMYWMLNERRTPFLPLPPQVPSSTMEDEARKRRFMGESFPAPAHGSDKLKAIVLKACAYDPKDRFASASEMREVLLCLKNDGVMPSSASQTEAAEAPIVVPDPVPVAQSESAAAQPTPAEPEPVAPVFSAPTPAAQPSVHKKKRKRGAWVAVAASLLLAAGIGLAVWQGLIEIPAIDGGKPAVDVNQPTGNDGGITKPPVTDNENSQNTNSNQPSNNQDSSQQTSQNNKEETNTQDTQTPPTQKPSCTSHSFSGGICGNCG